MPNFKHSAFVGFCAAMLAGCAQHYSPNTYSSNAVQLANRVEAGVIIGFREVAISTNGNVGTVTGGAAGGVLGLEYANSALVAVGATAVGGIIGNALDHAVGDGVGWEYIVRKPNGDMLSVTQREKKPLILGQKVLVIMGPQARVVPDYSIAPEPGIVAVPVEEKKAEASAKVEPVRVEVVLSLPPGVSVHPAASGAQAPELEHDVMQPKPPHHQPSISDIITGMGLSSVLATSSEVPPPEPEHSTAIAEGSIHKQ
jgi:outer membrane lipoprotein SlyB